MRGVAGALVDEIDALEAKVAEMRSALVDCVDSLEYLHRFGATISGYGVRYERIKAAKAVLARIPQQQCTVRSLIEDVETVQAE